MGRVPVAVLISGRGSNLSALIRAAQARPYPAEIRLVLSNRAEAGGLAIAAEAGIETGVVDHRGRSREAFEAELGDRIGAAGVSLICLAGFMRLLTPGFVEARRNQILNIHPSLLPAFPGLDTHARALEAGVRISGCTVHFVSPEMDEGPIIAQSAVPVAIGDSPASLADRVLKAEHRLYPMALALVAQGRVRVVGKRALISGEPPLPDGLFVPTPD